MYYTDPQTKRHRYSPYGLAFSKEKGFVIGARPVIYLPDSEIDWIPAQQRWRVVRFEKGTVDHTGEREWRLLGSLDLTTYDGGFYVLVWNVDEAREVLTMDIAVKAKICGVLPMADLYQMF